MLWSLWCVVANNETIILSGLQGAWELNRAVMIINIVSFVIVQPVCWCCTEDALEVVIKVNLVVLISVGDVHNSVWKSVWFPRGELPILNLTPYARHFKLLGTRFGLKTTIKIWHSAALMLTLLDAPRIYSLLFKILLFYASVTINDLLVWLLKYKNRPCLRLCVVWN